MKPIPFFTDDITIQVHSASCSHFVGRAVSIREFANGRAVSLEETDEGELYARVGNGSSEFIEGPEA